VTAGLAIIVLASAGCIGRPPALDRQALRARADGEDAVLAQRLTLRADPEPAAYLAAIARRLGPRGADTVRLSIVEDPTLAAFAMPSGRLYVHTGLLSRLDNEDEVALVIALELARVPRGRSLRVAPALRGSLPHGDLGPTAAAIFGPDLRIAAAAAITGYGADAERQAEREALGRLEAAGYDGERALMVLRRLGTPVAAGGPLEVFLYGDARRMDERDQAMRPLVATTGARRPSTSGDGSAFEARMRSIVRDNAALDMRADRFDLARSELERVLGQAPRDPVARLLLGELSRLRSQRVAAGPERVARVRDALAAYRAALELDPGYVEPLRQLGLLYVQEHDTANARAALERYLALAPAAADAGRIREYLALLEEVRP
jgi:beta-barrel assembly-enhancing protease